MDSPLGDAAGSLVESAEESWSKALASRQALAQIGPLHWAGHCRPRVAVLLGVAYSSAERMHVPVTVPARCPDSVLQTVWLAQ